MDHEGREHSKSWLSHTLRGSERSSDTDKTPMPEANFGLGGVEYRTSHSQIGNRFFYSNNSGIPFRSGGLAPRKMRESQNRGVLIGSG